MRIYTRLKSLSLQKNIWKRIDAKAGFGRIESILSTNWLNPFLTFWINFRLLRFLDAIKFPIFVYGRPRVYCLSGKAEIRSTIYMGMIKINYCQPGAPGITTIQSEINNFGTIVFYGKGVFCTGVKVYNSGELTFGSNFKIMDMCSICCRKVINLGDEIRVAHGTQIIDSNYHFVIDTSTRQVYPDGGTINIGKSCWIANRSTIVSPANIPDFSVVASGSMVNKDFSSNGCELFIAGMPATIKKKGIRRILNLSIEKEIRRYYQEGNSVIYTLPENIELNEISNEVSKYE